MSYRLSLGKLGEDLAVRWLKKQGYNIIARNLKLSYQEIDIVARRGGILVFVEVKTRAENVCQRAEEAMDQRKTQNLKRAIALFLSQSRLNYQDLRLDLIAIEINKTARRARLKHYQNVA